MRDAQGLVIQPETTNKIGWFVSKCGRRELQPSQWGFKDEQLRTRTWLS